MHRLLHQGAVVTGAASGVGRAIAQKPAQQGTGAAIADPTPDAADATAAAFAAAGLQTMAMAMDVSDGAAVEAGVAAVLAAWGRIDILVCNAGSQVRHPVQEFPLADWRRMLAVHLDGVFLTTPAGLRRLYAAGRGSFVDIGAVHAKEASVLKAPYVTARHGMIALAMAVAKTGAKHGVRANTVCPGFVRTPLVVKQIPEQAWALGLTEAQVVREVMLNDTVDGQFTTLDDVAEAVLFLAAAGSNAMTGLSLIVSHGWCME